MVTTLGRNRTYTPAAIYYREADFLEYVREDTPYVARRIDEYLTLVLSMRDRRIIGVRIKGFRHLYNSLLKSENERFNHDFFSLTHVFEKVMKELGDNVFSEFERRRAYETAIEIAQVDQVQVASNQLAA